jgi:hypothetical protein
LLIPVNIGLAQQPEYAKWGTIAVDETKQQYPDQELVDYQYEGKVVISDKREQYNFKMTLELNEERKEVRVYVLVNPKKEELIDVYFDEV